MRTLRKIAVSSLVEIELFLLIFWSFNVYKGAYGRIVNGQTVSVINLLPLGHPLFTLLYHIHPLLCHKYPIMCWFPKEWFSDPYISNSLFS